jgi:hypothetical protein
LIKEEHAELHLSVDRELFLYITRWHEHAGLGDDASSPGLSAPKWDVIRVNLYKDLSLAWRNSSVITSKTQGDHKE